MNSINESDVCDDDVSSESSFFYEAVLVKKYSLVLNVMQMYMVQRDYSRANGSDACGFANYQMCENSSGTHHIRTVSRSCEYACGLSNY